jgi:hypothetical protein
MLPLKTIKWATLETDLDRMLNSFETNYPARCALSLDMPSIFGMLRGIRLPCYLLCGDHLQHHIVRQVLPAGWTRPPCLSRGVRCISRPHLFQRQAEPRGRTFSPPHLATVRPVTLPVSVEEAIEACSQTNDEGDEEDLEEY